MVNVTVDYGLFVGVCGLGHGVHGHIPDVVSNLKCAQAGAILTGMFHPRTIEPIQLSMLGHHLHPDARDQVGAR